MIYVAAVGLDALQEHGALGVGDLAKGVHDVDLVLELKVKRGVYQDIEYIRPEVGEIADELDEPAPIDGVEIAGLHQEVSDISGLAVLMSPWGVVVKLGPAGSGELSDLDFLVIIVCPVGTLQGSAKSGAEIFAYPKTVRVDHVVSAAAKIPPVSVGILHAHEGETLHEVR